MEIIAESVPAKVVFETDCPLIGLLGTFARLADKKLVRLL